MSHGVFDVLIASFLFGITPLGNNYVLHNGMLPDCVLLYQAAVMTLGATLFARRLKQSLHIYCRDAVKLMLIGAIGIGFTDYFLNLAMTQMQVSSVIMLHFMYPTIVLLASVLFFHQSFSKLTLIAMLASVGGLILVTDFSGAMTPLGVLFALLSAVFYAGFVLTNDHGDFNRYPLMVKLFYMSLGTVLLYGSKVTISGNLSFPVNISVWFVLVVVVGFGSMIGFYFITAGVKSVGASKAAFLNMLEPTIGVVGGVLLYHDVIGIKGMIGCVCVLLSVLLIALDGANNGNEASRTV